MFTRTSHRNRRAVSLENDDLRLTALIEGGHVAEVFDKPTATNPLWTPPWNSIEPSTFSAAEHAQVYGTGTDAKLLAGIMGHSICLDMFGGPSDDEARAVSTTRAAGCSRKAR